MALCIKIKSYHNNKFQQYILILQARLLDSLYTAIIESIYGVHFGGTKKISGQTFYFIFAFYFLVLGDLKMSYRN